MPRIGIEVAVARFQRRLGEVWRVAETGEKIVIFYLGTPQTFAQAKEGIKNEFQGYPVTPLLENWGDGPGAEV